MLLFVVSSVLSGQRDEVRWGGWGGTVIVGVDFDIRFDMRVWGIAVVEV